MVQKRRPWFIRVWIPLFSSVLLITGCGKPINFLGFFENSSSQNSNGTDLNHAGNLKICTRLDFTGIAWPTEAVDSDREAFKLALNVSGSFEGDNGWANLTGNFDGQGMSMGLLNQNLGSGSLQPLLIDMKNSYMQTLAKVFAPGRLKSFLGMLQDWDSSRVQDLSNTGVPDRLSGLDDPNLVRPLAGTDKNLASVAWARSNLYSGSNFKPEWESELKALAGSPEYRSIQLNAAWEIHKRVFDYFGLTAVHQIRAYLFLFDILVQNGGLYNQDIRDFKIFINNNPQASTTSRLEQLLNLRLREVSDTFKNDVRQRKMTIINGKGVVHQASRNLERQFCYDRLIAFH